MYLTVYCKLYQVDPLDNDAFKGYLFGDAEKYAELQSPISGT